jgi:predicted nucleic acid-binding protein
MSKPTIYLETTIFNFPFVDDAPQYKADALRLFEEIKDGKFQAFTSEYVVEELEAATDILRNEQLELIQKYGITKIPSSDEAKWLADVYISAGIIPLRYRTDATHIAVATVTGVESIISLNFQHIVKHKTIIETEKINAREGYKRVFIHTPAEVIEWQKHSMIT